jgi:hypothetical protein
MREPVDNDVLQPPTLPTQQWLNHASRREADAVDFATYREFKIAINEPRIAALEVLVAELTAERDMLARRLHELTQPAPDEKIMALSDAVTNAVRVMQRSGIR